MPLNHQILLDNRPVCEAVASNFTLVCHPTPALQSGQVLVQHHYLSLDPYMRGRMKLVFISTVTTPVRPGEARAAIAMVTSSSVITTPPWVTL